MRRGNDLDSAFLRCVLLLAKSTVVVYVQPDSRRSDQPDLTVGRPTVLKEVSPSISTARLA